MPFKDYITEVPDFPTKGVNFKDISPLLDSPHWKEVIKRMGDLVQVPDHWIGIDARGFLFASALSYEFGGGIVMCRKVGKLPPVIFSHYHGRGVAIVTRSYKTEYSEDTLQIKQGGGTAVIVDDVLATGGTLEAANYLTGITGYDVIDNLVLIDLKYIPKVMMTFADGAKEFGLDVKSLIQYE